jgi:hypothetical protein
VCGSACIYHGAYYNRFRSRITLRFRMCLGLRARGELATSVAIPCGQIRLHLGARHNLADHFSHRTRTTETLQTTSSKHSASHARVRCHVRAHLHQFRPKSRNPDARQSTSTLFHKTHCLKLHLGPSSYSELPHHTIVPASAAHFLAKDTWISTP